MTGPPARIWSNIRGMTLPLLPSTLPKRTVTNRVSRASLPIGLHDQLGDPLARTHHARRVDGLVGRDQDEALHPVVAGHLGDDPRADDVVLDRLAGIRLHQRHVLVGGGMEDEVRPVLGKHRRRFAPRRSRRRSRCARTPSRRGRPDRW